MIRIYRPTSPPEILSKEGKQEKGSLCAQYDANPVGYDLGTVQLPTAKRAIYGHKSVRKKLKEIQNNKCCYSEARFVRDAVPVEHFRPKGAIGKRGSNDKSHPGYYWLAYDWSNLLLCKHGVNSDKKDYFPLLNENDRVKNHYGDVNLERPKIIDPASENPRDHIRFHDDEPVGVTKRGKYTVNLLLRHPDIEDDRRTYFDLLKCLKQALEVLGNTGTNPIQAQLNKAIQPDAKYSSMAIDLLNCQPSPVTT